MTRGILLAALVLLSCTAPLYESAQVHKGFSAAAGIGYGSNEDEGNFWSVTLQPRYGLNTWLALGVQGSWSTESEHVFEPMRSSLPSGYFDVKVKPWKSGALLFSHGWPWLYSVHMLQDVGRVITVRAGGSYLAPDNHFFGYALGIHPRLTRNLRGHVSGAFWVHDLPSEAEIDAPYTWMLGIGLEFLPGAK